MTHEPDTPPAWLGDPPADDAEVFADTAREGWDEHARARDEDEARPEELPGGYVWQAVYDEAAAAAGGDPRDFWNRLSEDERGRYCTLAAVGRRRRREQADADARAASRPNPLPFISARELVAQTPPIVPWVVRHYLARGALTELDGRAKRAGKTTLLGHLFACVLGRRDFLGQPTERTPIVLLTEMADTPLRQLLERTRLVEEDDLRILRWTDTRLVRWPDVVADSIAECVEHGAELLVVDTLPQFAGIRGDSENDAGAALAALEPLQAASASGLAVAIVRHERKGGGDVGESGRGSTAFTGAVDIVLRLAQPLNPARETIRQLSVLSRFDGAPADLMIELTDEGYDVLGEETAVVFADAREAIRSFLPNAPEGWAEREIIEALPHHSRTTIQRAIAMLVEQGDLARMGSGKRGSPFTWGRLLPGQTGFFQPGVPPLRGSPPRAEREPGANGHVESVGDRMAGILDDVDVELVPDDEPPPSDEPDYMGSLFGQSIEGRA